MIAKEPNPDDRVTTFQGADGLWYWHLVAPNGRIMADGGEGYVLRAEAMEAAERVTGRSVDDDGPVG
jgi:uncharacterized protein YegP (UPF0339 family)